MNKKSFLDNLAELLSSLPKAELEKTLSYYDEIIDDQIEEGMTEEEAIDALGDIAHLAELAIANTSMSALVKAKVKKEKNSTLQTILLILGFPLWFPLLAASVIVVIALYIVTWSVVASVWAASASGVAAAVVSFFYVFFTRGIGNRIVYFGVFIAGAGLSILLFFAALVLSKLLIKFTRYIWKSAKISLAGKRSA